MCGKIDNLQYKILYIYIKVHATKMLHLKLICPPILINMFLIAYCSMQGCFVKINIIYIKYQMLRIESISQYRVTEKEDD